MNELPDATFANRPLRSRSATGRPSTRWTVVAIFLGVAGLVGSTRADCADIDVVFSSFGEPYIDDVERLIRNSFETVKTVSVAEARQSESPVSHGLGAPFAQHQSPRIIFRTASSHSGTPPDLAPTIANSDGTSVTVVDDFINGELDNSYAYGPRFNIRDDLGEFLPLLKDDAYGVVNWNNAAILGGALAASIAIRQDLDGDVRNNIARHPQRWGDISETLGDVGDAVYQIPVILAIYGVSVKRDDQELHEFSAALISAYTINGLSTLAIKGITNTDRPSDVWNDGHYGFPSFHASSSFTIASVVDEYYGYKAGLPAYALAGLISWSRIDQRDHDLSDVVFGAALGYVIGHSVAGRHFCGNSHVRLLPYIHPTEGTTGLMVDLSF